MGATVFVLLFSALLLRFVYPASMESYCFTPPFISQAAAPNVLLVIDVSGSMGWCAYNPASDGRGCCDDPGGCGWTYTGNEEGYFIPDRVYRYNATTNYWEETNATPATCPNRWRDIDWANGAYTGSCLNFHFMTRIDLVRWSLTGGSLSSCPTGINVTNPSFNQCNPEAYGTPGDQTSCDDAGCVLRTRWGVRVKVPWERINISLLFQLKNLSLRPRIGVMFFSGGGVRHNALVYIGDFKGSNDYDALNPYKNVISQINVENPYGATPTAPALWDAYNYFAQNNPEYGGFHPEQGIGDRWRNPMYQCIDRNNNGQCEGSEFELVPCAKNFVILLTDGQWNVGGGPPAGFSCSIYDGYERHSADPVVPAYWLHRIGFTNRITNIQSYVEAVYGIGLWLGGTGELSLKNVAMYGSFDRSRTWPDNLSGYPTNSCTMDDCGDGVGSACTALPPSSPDWDRDGDNVPDTFHNARNATEIKNAILSALLDILRRASSGATVATLASRSQVSSLIVQPYFYPSYVRDDGAQISWLGFLRSFWVDANQDLREDTVESKILNISGTSIDRVFQFFYDPADASTKAVILDENYPEVCSADSTKSIQELIPVFNAGCTLADTDPSKRNVYFNKDGALTKLITSEATYFQNIWKVCSNDATKLCSSDADCGTGTCQAISSSEASCIIEYLLGNDNPSGCGSFGSVKRTRTLDVTNFCSNVGITGERTWKLGDIVYSTPVGAGNRKLRIYDSRYGDITYYQYWTSTEYQSRFGIVAVSANDGMLHIFRIGHLKETFDPAKPIELVDAPDSSTSTRVGVEEFAFMPKNAIPYLYWYGHNNYCRVPTVDYRINILDVSANLQGCVKKGDKCWSTILIGVMGFGGKKITTDQTYASSVFALDLTGWLNGGSINDIKLLWETKLPDNTLTLSFPAIIRTGDPNGNGSWYVIIGSGPTQLKNSVDEEDYPTNPKIYFIPIKNGLTAGDIVEVSINLPADTRAAVGDIYPIDFDNDYRDDSLYFGMYGKYQVGTNWYSWGGFFRLRLRNTADTSLASTNGYKAITSLTSSDISAVVDLRDYATGNHIPPVFGAPTFSRDDEGNLWVYFGTGKFLSLDDRTPPYTNYIFGIKDPCWNGSCQITYSSVDIENLTQADMLSGEVIVTETKQICSCEGGVCDNKEVVVATNATPPSPTTKKGWSVQLGDYEAAYSQPAVFGSIVYFNTYKSPGSDVCALEGTNNLYALHYTSGRPYAPRPPLLRPDMVEDAGGGRVLVRGFVNLGPGVPAGGQPIQITERAIYLQTSTGKIERIPYQATIRRGIVLWIEK